LLPEHSSSRASPPPQPRTHIIDILLADFYFFSFVYSHLTTSFLHEYFSYSAFSRFPRFVLFINYLRSYFDFVENFSHKIINKKINLKSKYCDSSPEKKKKKNTSTMAIPFEVPTANPAETAMRDNFLQIENLLRELLTLLRRMPAWMLGEC